MSVDFRDAAERHWDVSQRYENRALQEFDPTRSPSGIDEQIAEASLGIFMTKAENWVFKKEEAHER